MAQRNRKTIEKDDGAPLETALDHRTSRLLPHLLFLTVAGMIAVGCVGLVSGLTMAEKLLTTLATPVGIVWISLMFLVYSCLVFRQTWPAIAGLFCWLVLTIGGNQLVADYLARSLESPYQNIDLDSIQPLDAVIVLGGGTDSTINGRSQLGYSGDRIAVAARLFHARKAKILICTGTQQAQSNDLDLHPRQEAAEILIGLGIPPSVVHQLEGKNTSKEMESLKTWLDENDNCNRVGILTSAWHLPRAMRLAKTNGLVVEPIPSDFASASIVPSPILIVPNAKNLLTTARMTKEYLARIVGR